MVLNFMIALTPKKPISERLVRSETPPRNNRKVTTQKLVTENGYRQDYRSIQEQVNRPQIGNKPETGIKPEGNKREYKLLRA